MDYEKLIRAIELVREGLADRIDGDGWKVYRAGAIIRVDLNV